ncbi:hypothetical protein XELAEV_18028988mg [Xenopus laevis]|uniref:Uncharacterized protein n=1 Tax=Xenopus laevis TaxID=8355 RepID=A0A974CT60_XENLA|nr:hypothetical protein XELAEV_18028988mg [Xenopus laevis]
MTHSQPSIAAIYKIYREKFHCNRVMRQFPAISSAPTRLSLSLSCDQSSFPPSSSFNWKWKEFLPVLLSLCTSQGRQG